MKSLRRARVTWLSDSSYLGKWTSPMRADVFVNGAAAVINAPDAEGDMQRVDRIVGAVVTEGKDGRDEFIEISGRSTFLADMGLHRDDQQVRIKVQGGKCATC